MIDAATLRDWDLVVRPSGVILVAEDARSICLRKSRGWLRRLAPEEWRTAAEPGGHEAAVRSAWMAALLSIVSLADVQWLSEMDAIYGAEDKLVQQRACTDLGIPYPPTILATRPERIPAEFGQRLVVKPLAVGHFRDEAGVSRVVHATAMERDDERLSLLAGAPFLVQRLVDARFHLRIVTVGDRAWACELDATELPLDWRAAERAHSSFRLADYRELRGDAIRLTRRLRLHYSSQDWIVDGSGDSYFLDLNPAGQWLFLPDEVAAQVTEAIANWLTGDHLA